MAEQAPRETDRDAARGACVDPKLRQQISHDVVIIASIERDLPAPPAHRQRARHVEFLVAVERRNLYRRDIFYLEKLAPEAVIQSPPAHRRLQIKAEERDDFGHASAVRNQLR